MNPIGLYIHVPFCVRKCDYCDFYSVADTTAMDAYVAETVRRLQTLDVTADTLYFGGGTPSLLGAKRLTQLIEAAAPLLTDNAELTVEVNPGDGVDLIPALASAGVNRLSIGMQSHDDAVLQALTRRHTAKQVETVVEQALRSGFRHLSLDVMLGTPRQSEASLRETLAYATQSGADHVSAYLLKVEPNTPFARRESELCLPDEDETAQRYLLTVDVLRGAGFSQYEISNFARPDGESRHNLKYWLDEPYLGLGPSAHSYWKGKRFYFPRNLQAYLNGAEPTPDGEGGSFEEYAMLRLRLTRGLRAEDVLTQRPSFASEWTSLHRRAQKYAATDLLRVTENAVALTPNGFLVSNALIGDLLFG